MREKYLLSMEIVSSRKDTIFVYTQVMPDMVEINVVQRNTLVGMTSTYRP